MLKSAKDVSNILCDKLVKSGNHVMTITNDELYALSERERIRGAFLTDLTRETEAKGYIFASGDKVHIISQDTNYAPIKK